MIRKNLSRYFMGLLVVVLLINFAVSAINSNNFHPQEVNIYMPTPTEQQEYDKLWKEVTEAMKKGLPKTALPLVNKIYEKAKNKNHVAQFIKALLHKLRFIQEIEEDAFILIQKEINDSLTKSQFPITPVLHSVLADQYWRFYQANRYRMLNRTTTSTDYKPEDIRTWDARHLIETVLMHYDTSLAQAEQTQKINIALIDDILIQKENTRTFRPTLYDFLAHRAIDFFKDSEAGLTQPQYQFTLNDARYLSPADVFVQLPLSTPDTFSFQFYALKHLQDLIKFHLAEDSPEALVDVDLERLAYIYQATTIENKDALYETILRQMMKKYDHQPVVTEIYFELASLYYRLGSTYKAGEGETYKWHKQKSLALCQEALKKYPDSFGANNCQRLRTEIESKSLNLTMEKVTTPHQPMRALLQYRNLKTIYAKIVKTDFMEWRNNQAKEHERYGNCINIYKAKTATCEWQVYLPDEADYQTHSTEIKIASLEPGMYILLTANTPNFDFSGYPNAVVYTLFHVSHIAYSQRQTLNNRLELSLLHRDTGYPLNKATVQLWSEEYDQKKQQYIYVKNQSFGVDENGFLALDLNKTKKNYFFLELCDGPERLFLEQTFYMNSQSTYDPVNTRTYFFTDRAIYRPGQTVYFKGIMVQVHTLEGEKCKLLPHTSSQVELMDVNRQQVANLDVKTNEYGTFSGSFQLPLGRLNGTMSITNDSGSVTFQMEEYKRPKFKVDFKPLEKAFKLHEKVTATGLAEAYAGYHIDNAEVKYRVTRETYYPYPWYCYHYNGYWRPPTPAMEITNGVSKTKEDGTFDITFEAVPDTRIAENLKPAFIFTVSADVADINGETRSTQQIIHIGYTALKLTLNFPDQIDKEKKSIPFTFNTSHLGGDFLAAQGDISIYQLKDPKTPYRPPLWSTPDKPIINEEQFRKEFPLDVYQNELDWYQWEKTKKVWQSPFDTAKTKALTIPTVKEWQCGHYVAEMTSVDAFGNELKEVRYFTIFSSTDNQMPFASVDWFAMLNETVEPGQNAIFLIGSSLSNVRVLYEIEFHNQIIKSEVLVLNNQQRRIEIPIKEEHRGNLGFHLTFVRNNRFYNHSQTILVPWSNKVLQLSFETFRNKLWPGEKEEWRIKIKGPQGDKVAAEMVASLYDASLDAFTSFSWGVDLFPFHYVNSAWNSNAEFGTVYSQQIGQMQLHYYSNNKEYDQLNWFDFYWDSYGGGRRYKMARMPEAVPAPAGLARDGVQEVVVTGNAPMVDTRSTAASATLAQNITTSIEKKENSEPAKTSKPEPVNVRTNFNETAFFYPHLRTNPEGEIIIAFTIPEALTKWKMMGFAHTQKLENGFIFNELITQKDLMVVPNAPRFLREGDQLVLTTKITNLAEQELNGHATLTLLDAVTLLPVDAAFQLQQKEKPFTAKKGQSAVVGWCITVPEDLDAVTYRITAQAGKFSDGEEMVLPILKNRMLVTESLPLPVRSKQSKSFQFDKLISSAHSKTIKSHKLTLEFTANPVWYAVQALPYMIEYPHECFEQMFSRYYANSMASYIVHTHPQIKRVFELWKSAKDSPNALLSNLEKNQELKSVLLQETPWVLNGQNENQRKQRMALLFDLNTMAGRMEQTLQKLAEGQLPSGGWSWFKGMKECRWITQHIVCGFAHLNRLKVIDAQQHPQIRPMMNTALPYLDRQINQDYQQLLYHKTDLTLNHLTFEQIHYLYARSYFTFIPIADNCKKAFEYYKGQVKTYWHDFNKNKYLQGMIALILKRYGDTTTAMAIGKSLKEYALYSEEMGMYWKTSYGYYWYQAPIETHALMIEVFSEVMQDNKSVDDLKTWLLKSKQTQDWGTTKATADACYALLLRGEDWLKENVPPEITLGQEKPIVIIPGKSSGNNEMSTVEAGTGYFKTSWSNQEITPDMGYVRVQNNNQNVAWGSLYWQYFENLDKITAAETPLKLSKKLFVEQASPTGPVLLPITDGTALKVGDRVKVRIELRVDRDMEYVHMKDMRAATMEPENVISGYRWQDGLGYYETTKDSATHFFIDYLFKGTYVFEYPLRVTHEGNFSNGITSIQCMYAPEFTSHSEGIRLKIGSK